MTPEKFSFLEEKLFKHHARDVYKTPIIMKKGRLATKISILTDDEYKAKLLHQLFLHSTTIGVRILPLEKLALKRNSLVVETNYGHVRFKESYLDDKVKTFKPEYDDIVKLATNGKFTLDKAEKIALDAYNKRRSDK